MPNPSLGDVLQSARKRRGLSQRELAQASGVSLSLIRKIEQGERLAVRVETLRKLAAALEITTTVLLSSDVADPPNGIAAHQAAVLALQPVRDALQTDGDPQYSGQPPTAAGLRAAVAGAVRLYHDDRYAELYRALPVLVCEAQSLVRQADPQALAVRARVLQLVGSLATQTRVFDVAVLGRDTARVLISGAARGATIRVCGSHLVDALARAGVDARWSISPNDFAIFCFDTTLLVWFHNPAGRPGPVLHMTRSDGALFDSFIDQFEQRWKAGLVAVQTAEDWLRAPAAAIDTRVSR